MKTVCGLTIRGVAYFGASVHICIGGIFFLLFLDQLLHQAYYKNVSNMDSFKFDKESVIYFGLFLPLGILIFKAIDKENKTLIKWASFIFLTLQLFGMIIKVKFGPNYGPTLLTHPRGPYPSGPPSSNIIDNIKILSIEIAATIAYLVILYLYSRQLECFPGRIYSQGGMIPLYSRSSTFFDHHSRSESQRHGNHRGHHHGRSNLNHTTPFTYNFEPHNFEPPPPYSSTNNLTSLPEQSSNGNQRQAESSRGSVFGRIGNISLKKSCYSQPHPLLQHHQHNSTSTSSTPGNSNPINSSPPVLVMVNATNNRCVVVPSSSEMDSRSVLMESRRPQNDLSITSDRRSQHNHSLLNLKELD